MNLSRFLVVSSLLATAALSAAQSLNIGDTAPKLNVTKWVKGSAQTLGNGNVTVVEFWATWCGPCKQSIPHLTELAHKYKGKVNFVGVSVWERQPADYTTKVPAFVKEFGGKMDFNVATEGPGAFMAKNWLTPAGENGIPSAFLINKQGKVSWIGHPMDGLDKAIDATLSGKENLVAARKKRTEARAKAVDAMKQQQAMMAKMEPIRKAVLAKKWQLASTESDKIIAHEPRLRPLALNSKLFAMTQGNLKGLDSFLTSLGNEPFAKNPEALNQIIWSVVEKDLKLSPSAYRSAANLGAKMMALSPKNSLLMDTYALALWRAGDKAKAIETEKKVIALASTDKTVSAADLKEFKGRLKQFGG